jgi:hypothetical protein
VWIAHARSARRTRTNRFARPPPFLPLAALSPSLSGVSVQVLQSTPQPSLCILSVLSSQLSAPSTLSLVLHVLTSSPSRNASPSLVSPPDTMESTQSREHPCCVCAAPTNKRCTGCASKNSDETSSFSLFFCSSEGQKLVRRLPTPSKTLSNPPCAGLLHAQASLWEEGYSGSLSEAICR